MWLPKSLLTSSTYTEHTGCVISALRPAWVGSTWEQSCQFNTRIKLSKKQVTSQTPSAQLCWGFGSFSSSICVSHWNFEHFWYKSSASLVGLSCALPRVCWSPGREFEWVALHTVWIWERLWCTFFIHSKFLLRLKHIQTSLTELLVGKCKSLSLCISLV